MAIDQKPFDLSQGAVRKDVWDIIFDVMDGPDKDEFVAAVMQLVKAAREIDRLLSEAYRGN